MAEIVFKCRRCGNESKHDILPSKHSIVGTALELTRRADCCKRPSYIDTSGHVGSFGFIYNRL